MARARDLWSLWAGVVCQIGCALLLAGCVGAANHFATYTPQFMPTPASRYSVGTVVNSSDPLKRSDVPADFDPSAELRLQLERQISANGLAYDTNAPDAIILMATITDYDPGNAGLRWLSPGAGATILTVKCDLRQNGVDAGTIRVRRTTETGGLYSVGQWKTIFQPVAGDIVDALKQKIRQGK